MKWNSIFFLICLVAWTYLLPTQSAGQTRNLQTTGLMLNGIWMLNSSTGWAVGDAGLILYTDNGGTTWSVQVSGTSVNLYGVWGADAVNVWAGGTSGAMRKYDGLTWAGQTLASMSDVQGLAGAIPDLWAPGANGTLWHSSDQLGILKRTGPLTDNRLDLSDLLTGAYCLWLLDTSTEARVARVVKR